MEVNLNKSLNYRHTDLFQSTASDLCVRGGANAGKSYSLADKILLQPRIQKDKKLKALVVRKTLPSLRSSIIDIFKRRAEVHHIDFDMNEQKHTAQCENLEIVFKSLNNKEDYIAVKSMTDIDFIWANEITELRELDYDILRMRIRGGESSFSQFMFDFNPVGKTSWVYKRFYQNGNGNGNGNKVHKLLYTVLDNPWATEDEVEKLRAYKDIDDNLYKIYFKGEWGELEGVIYDWDLVDWEQMPESVDERFYGLDFGYSVDPAALIRIYRKADEYWLECLIYETGLTNRQLAKRMKDEGVSGNDVIYADSAEPKSIDEIHGEGFNIQPCEKGPDSVRAGVDYVRSLKVHVLDIPGAEYIQREQKAYIWKKNKDGESLNVPIDFNNHAMDAVRYGIYTHTKRVTPHVWRA